MKVKCKFTVGTYGNYVDDVLLKYKFEKDWFYKGVYIKKSDIYVVPEEYTEKYEAYTHITEEDIVKEIANMSVEEIKKLCQRVIKRSMFVVKNYKADALYSAIEKIRNMNFEIELDLKATNE